MNKLNLKEAALMVGATAFAVVTLTSCNNDEEVTNQLEHRMDITAPIRVQVNDFTMSVDDIPKAQTRAAVNPANYTSIKAITLAFYATDGTNMYESTQRQGDTSFGTFSCNLPIGSYTMVVIGTDTGENDQFSLISSTEAAYTSALVRETFWKTQIVSVTSSTPLDLSVTLNRIVPQLTIFSTDARPAGVEKIRTTYSAGYKSFNPTTGLGIGNAGFSLTNSPSASVGSTVSFRNYAFLATDEQTMTITLDVLDAEDHVLISKIIPDVPLKRNRKTILRGPLFTPSASTASFQLETSWLEDVTVTF